MNISYEQALEDWTYLWKEYGAASDMTGGYVDQSDLELLMRRPTKATARDCMCNQICYWFSVGTDPIDRQPDPTDERLIEIAERHGETFP